MFLWILINAHRFFATGIAGLSVVTDSLSAIKHAKVYPLKDSDEVVTDYQIEGNFPTYGNNDDRADDIAIEVVKTFMNECVVNTTTVIPNQQCQF